MPEVKVKLLRLKFQGLSLHKLSKFIVLNFGLFFKRIPKIVYIYKT